MSKCGFFNLNARGGAGAFNFIESTLSSRFSVSNNVESESKSVTMTITDTPTPHIPCFISLSLLHK